MSLRYRQRHQGVYHYVIRDVIGDIIKGCYQGENVITLYGGGGGGGGGGYQVMSWSLHYMQNKHTYKA